MPLRNTTCEKFPAHRRHTVEVERKDMADVLPQGAPSRRNFAELKLRVRPIQRSARLKRKQKKANKSFDLCLPERSIKAIIAVYLGSPCLGVVGSNAAISLRHSEAFRFFLKTCASNHRLCLEGLASLPGQRLNSGNSSANSTRTSSALVRARPPCVKDVHRLIRCCKNPRKQPW
jgi:hypothetical protein